MGMLGAGIIDGARRVIAVAGHDYARASVSKPHGRREARAFGDCRQYRRRFRGNRRMNVSIDFMACRRASIIEASEMVYRL